MFEINKKNLILFLLLLILLIIIFYWQNIKEIVSPVTENLKPAAEEKKSPEGQTGPQATPTEQPKQEFSRGEFMDYASKNIAALSPEKPVLGGHWYVTRFWFVKDNAAYVEYEDGHILRQILIEAREDGGKINYKMVGYFEPGTDEWILKQGDDPYFGKLRELYEWDNISKSWRKR